MQLTDVQNSTLNEQEESYHSVYLSQSREALISKILSASPASEHTKHATTKPETMPKFSALILRINLAFTYGLFF